MLLKITKQFADTIFIFWLLLHVHGVRHVLASSGLHVLAISLAELHFELTVSIIHLFHLIFILSQFLPVLLLKLLHLIPMLDLLPGELQLRLILSIVHLLQLILELLRFSLQTCLLVSVGFVLLFELRILNNEFRHFLSELLVALFYFLGLLDFLSEQSLLGFEIVGEARELVSCLLLPGTMSCLLRLQPVKPFTLDSAHLVCVLYSLFTQWLSSTRHGHIIVRRKIPLNLTHIVSGLEHIGSHCLAIAPEISDFIRSIDSSEIPTSLAAWIFTIQSSVPGDDLSTFVKISCKISLFRYYC